MIRTLLLALAACQAPTSARAPLVEQDAMIDMVGGWRWLHRTEENGTVRIEDEQWRLHYTQGSPLAGSYLRTVEIRSTDALGFPCNQRPWYRQRALFDVVIELDGDGGYRARETGYTAEPSPCDHEFRHVTDYAVEPRGNRMDLRWDGGSQTLWHVDDESVALAKPWADTPTTPAGAWRWQTRSVDDDRNLREETEWWEITPRTDTLFDATYRRRVRVHSSSGQPIACANAPSWTFDDAYVLSGEREDEHWHLVERAVDAGAHPCLAATPQRALDEATAEVVGDFVVLEWRGKRRQVLYRP